MPPPPAIRPTLTPDKRRLCQAAVLYPAGIAVPVLLLQGDLKRRLHVVGAVSVGQDPAGLFLHQDVFSILHPGDVDGMWVRTPGVAGEGDGAIGGISAGN